jgi:hypothetical protein
MYITGNPLVDLKPMTSNLAVALGGTRLLINALPFMWLFPLPALQITAQLATVPAIVPQFYVSHFSQV